MDNILDSTVHLLNGDFTFCCIPIIDVIKASGENGDPRDIAIVSQGKNEQYVVIYATLDARLCNCEECIKEYEECGKQCQI